MNRKMMLSAAAAMSAFAAFAASTVSDVVARQRWPWSETVDIDYTLTGDKGDVTFSATWDGQATPVIIGTDFQVEAGQHRFEWCPTNNYAGQTLTGFTVTAEAGSTADHKYLILDLVDGGYTFMAAPPNGGWTDEYKSTKMVFARCPAGVYTNGISGADFDYIVAPSGMDAALSNNYRKAWTRHVTTFSSDWYVGIYALTEAQYARVMNGASNSSYAKRTCAYNKLRGTTNDTPFVNWPETKYSVTVDSIVDKMRKIAHGTLVIDLPSEEQFEAAMRAGTTTYWPNGGTRFDSYETLTNIYNEISPANNGVVGYYSITNAFGIYDFLGYGASSLCLDAVRPYAQNRASYPYYGLSDATDPVGALYAMGSAYAGGFLQQRVLKGQINLTTSGGALYSLLPCIRQTGLTNNSGYNVRFAIHLKPLNFGD